ncbi:hypothetical protein [Thermoflexus sp.]|uniref:MinD/ParA family ATP-binding protein n=1 Tax=Thermoflexus sp. TaxID=1969742 RepID=UPI002ADE26AA|nr:hypothetical protein [Thermoflexus sp.]
MGNRVAIVLGKPGEIGGGIADILARNGYEPFSVAGQLPLELLISSNPALIVVVGPETTYSTGDVERMAKSTEAPVIVVASVGTAWASWAEASKYPLVTPDQAIPVFRDELNRLIEQSRKHDRDRYLGEIYRAGEVIVASLPRVIAFGGPKGGTGKTSAGVNAGVLLAARGLSVCLCDAESDTRGNVPDFLRMGTPDRPISSSLVRLAAEGAPPVGSGGVFEASSGRVANIWTVVPPPRQIKWNLRMLAGLLDMSPLLQPGAAELMARAADWLSYAIDTSLQEGYTVIIDAGNNLMSPLSVRAINRAQILYIVLDPEDTALVGGASWLANIYRLAGPEAFSSKVRVIFNRVRNESVSNLIGRLRHHIESILDHRLPRAIPAYVLPLVDVDYARMQTNLDLGIEHIFVLQVLTKGPYADALMDYYKALLSILSEHYPFLNNTDAGEKERQKGLLGHLNLFRR